MLAQHNLAQPGKEVRVCVLIIHGLLSSEPAHDARAGRQRWPTTQAGVFISEPASQPRRSILLGGGSYFQLLLLGWYLSVNPGNVPCTTALDKTAGSWALNLHPCHCIFPYSVFCAIRELPSSNRCAIFAFIRGVLHAAPVPLLHS